MMMKGLAMDENMSNLTSTSGEVMSASSATRIETGSVTTNIYPQQSFTSTIKAPTQKKKRSLPGNPDPDAEVLALSPKTLLATNRFICEICNKGFQRDQNLQLHRRGHNLPWKLKQRSNKDVNRKKVYVCPEVGCVHHDPSKALGDLTGIKKHFCRKHGEKKWKCEKCSKRYAVQSDWKAHSKICGTREYRCDCGTLFSRRDSFITHRAFCDALAEESARSITNNNNNNTFLSAESGHHQDTFLRRTDHNITNIPPWLTCQVPPLDLSTPPPLFSNTPQRLDQNTILPSAHMSATALLQKAAQMGVTMSSSSSATGSSVSAPASNFSTREGFLSSLGPKPAGSSAASVGSDFVEQVGASQGFLLHEVMSSLSSPTGFESSLHGLLKRARHGVADEQGFTRDFLGLKAFPETADFGNISGLTRLSSNSSSGYGQQSNLNQTSWQG